MDVWLCESESSLYALVGYADGKCLPAEFGRWQPIRLVALSLDASVERAAITFIQENGYCCFDRFRMEEGNRS